MRKIHPLRSAHCIAFGLLVALTAPAQVRPPAPDPDRHIDPGGWAHTFVNHLSAGKFAEAYAQLHPSTAENLDLDEFRAIAGALRLNEFKTAHWYSIEDFERFGRTYAEGFCNIGRDDTTQFNLQLLAEQMGDTYRIVHFRPYSDLGTDPDTFLAPPLADCQKLARNILSAFAEAVATGDFTAYNESYWIPDDTVDGAAELKEGFSGFASFDLSFVPDSRIILDTPFVKDEEVLHLSGAAISDANHRKLTFSLQFSWLQKGGRGWLLTNQNTNVRYHVPVPLTEPPAPDVALALAKVTLADFQKSVLGSDLENFAKRRASPFLLEKIGGAKAVQTEFEKFADPEYALKALDLESLRIEEPSVQDGEFLAIKGTAQTPTQIVDFDFTYFREGKAWMLSGINTNFTSREE